MTAPQSTPLPPAPQRGESEDVFVNKSNTWVAAQEVFRQELQEQADFVNNEVVDLDSAVTSSAASASAALTSENNASTSESNSSTSETNAAASELAASNSASAASASESNAASSESAASASATTASNAATAAEASETIATTKASEASASAASSADSATLSQDARILAQAAGNYAGVWADLTGSVAAGVSVAHNSEYWGSLVSIADITLSEPGVSSDWQSITELSGTAAQRDTGTGFNQVPLNTNIVYPVANVAELRALTGISVGQKFQLDGHTNQGIGGDPLTATKLHTTEMDDNGNLFVVDGVVIERKDPFPVNPVNFGALIDGSDSYAAIAAAIAVADDSGIVFTEAHSYGQKITGIAPWVQKDGATLTYIGAETGDATIEIGTEASTIQEAKCIFDISNNAIKWGTPDHTGLRLINFANCEIEYRNIFGFTVGIQELGFNEGFAYNTVTVGILNSNKTLIEWATQGNGSPRGYHNENLYLGGRLTNITGSPTGVQRIGVRCYSIDGFNISHNNNVWLKPSFELFDGNNSLPVSMEVGTQNEFLQFRNEQNGDIFALETGEASDNLYVEGYSDKISNNVKLTSTSLHRDSVYIPSRAKGKDHSIKFFDSGNIRDLVNYYSFNRINSKHVQLFDAAAGVTTAVSLTQSFAINSDSVSMTSSTHGIGISVDTRRCRRFGIRPNCAAAGGRVTVVCYDSAGAQITPVNGSTLFPMKSRTLSAETIFFGGYRFGVDMSADDDQWFQFTLDDTVDSIDIIFAAGSAALDLRSFTVYGFSTDDKAVPVAFLKTCREDVNLGTAKPTQGVHRVHDRINNVAPAVGQPFGWVCITAGDFAGTPPVYASLANLNS